MKTLFILLTTIIFCSSAFGQQKKEVSKPSQIGITAPMRRPGDIQPARPPSTQANTSGNPAPSGNANELVQKIFANMTTYAKKSQNWRVGSDWEYTTFTNLSLTGNVLIVSERVKGRYIDKARDDCKVTIDKNSWVRLWKEPTTGIMDGLSLHGGGKSCEFHYEPGANNANFNQLNGLVEQLRNLDRTPASVSSNSQTSNANQSSTRITVNPAETAQINRLKRQLVGSARQTQQIQTGELADGKAKGFSHPLAGRIVKQYPVNNDCSTGIVGNKRVCWGTWGSTEGVQVRVKGPIAAGYSTYKGQNTVYYEWRIQIKNPTNNIACLNYKFTYKGGYRSYDEDIGAGIPMLGGACVVPNGTTEGGGNSESSKTFSPESDVHVDILNVRTCSKWKQNDSTTFECIE